MDDADRTALVERATEIATAYINNNSLPAHEVPDLLREIHRALQDMYDRRTAAGRPAAAATGSAEPKSITATTQDRVVCLECGKDFSTLKRHLRESHNLSPMQYRVKWGLSEDTPLVSQKLSSSRSAAARRSRLNKRS